MDSSASSGDCRVAGLEERVRIAIAGEGGTGKTTIAGTLARLMARRGHQAPDNVRLLLMGRVDHAGAG